DVFRVAGQPAPGLDGIDAARQNGHAVPALLAVPDGAVAGFADGVDGEFLLRRLQFLQAGDVGPGLLQPAQQHGQPAVDAVDVVGGDLHGRTLYRNARPAAGPAWPPISATAKGMPSCQSGAIRGQAMKWPCTQAAPASAASARSTPLSTPSTTTSGASDAHRRTRSPSRRRPGRLACPRRR